MEEYQHAAMRSLVVGKYGANVLVVVASQTHCGVAVLTVANAGKFAEAPASRGAHGNIPL